MKKYVRYIPLMLILLSFCCLIRREVTYADIDREGPILEGIEVLTPDVTLPATVKIKLDVSDNASEITTVTVAFRDSITGNQIEFYPSDVVGDTYVLQLDEVSYTAGKYELAQIYLIDSADNHTLYHADANYTPSNADNVTDYVLPSQYQGLYINVNPKTIKDEEAPKLQDIKVLTPEVVLSSSAKIELHITDNMSEIKGFTVAFRNEDLGKDIIFYSNDARTQIYELKLDATNFQVGNYKLYEINLVDTAGNSSVYYTSENYYVSNTTKYRMPAEYCDLSIHIVNPPVVENPSEVPVNPGELSSPDSSGNSQEVIPEGPSETPTEVPEDSLDETDMNQEQTGEGEENSSEDTREENDKVKGDKKKDSNIVLIVGGVVAIALIILGIIKKDYILKIMKK